MSIKREDRDLARLLGALLGMLNSARVPSLFPFVYEI